MLPIDPQYKRRHWGQIFFFFFFCICICLKALQCCCKDQTCATSVWDRFYLHCFIAHDQKKRQFAKEEKKKKRKRVRQNWFESKVRAGRVLIFTVRRDRGRNHMVILLFHAWFCFRFLIGSWKMNIKGRRASERFLVHFFFFLFLWFQIQYRFISNQ